MLWGCLPLSETCSGIRGNNSFTFQELKKKDDHVSFPGIPWLWLLFTYPEPEGLFPISTWQTEAQKGGATVAFGLDSGLDSVLGFRPDFNSLTTSLCVWWHELPTFATRLQFPRKHSIIINQLQSFDVVRLPAVGTPLYTLQICTYDLWPLCMLLCFPKEMKSGYKS